MTEQYQPLAEHVWEGRIDDPTDPDALRWHQVVQLIDLTSPPVISLPKDQKGFCFLGFCCDEGVKRNKGRIGAAKAPLSIRKEMANLACHFQQKAALFDAGDIQCFEDNLEKAQEELAGYVPRVFSLGLFPIILGGGHEIAFGHYKGIVAALESLGHRRENANSRSSGGSTGTVRENDQKLVSFRDKVSLISSRLVKLVLSVRPIFFTKYSEKLTVDSGILPGKLIVDPSLQNL